MRNAPLIPAEVSFLRLLAEFLRVECLVGGGKPSEALRVFQKASHLLAANSRLRPQIRAKVTCARLLDAFGRKQSAERLFDEVVDQDIEHEFYKDAYLDLRYLHGLHMKAGESEKAARICRRALSDPALAAIAHARPQALWPQFHEAAALHPIARIS